jgi:hypothetical protein
VSHGPGRWLNLVVWLALLGFGLSYGLNYGVSNHTFYMLPSVHALHPEYWARDWAVTQTHHYHFTFAWLAAGMLWLDQSGWLLGLANVVTIALGMACVWQLLKALVSREHAALAMLLVVLIASATRTGGPGTSYVFSDVFQPNTLGSAGVLAACWLLVVNRPLLSGLLLAVAGALHANYLVLCLPVFGVAQLAASRQRLLPRLAAQLGPSLLVLLVYLPVMRTTSSSPVSAEALRIYQDIRSPHHYRVETFAGQFVPWLGWQLLGAAALLDGAATRPQLRRLLAILTGFWALIVPSVLVAYLFVLRPLIQLYPWRLTSNCELLAQAAFAAAVISSARGPSEWPAPGRLARGLLGFGLLLVAIGAVFAGQFLPVVVAAIGLWLWLGSAKLLARPRLAARVSSCLLLALCIALCIANARRFSRLWQSSSLLGGKHQGAAELCQWLDAHTKGDELLLTPPADEDIRFQCHRAIVVDWKTAPMVPGEIMAWYQRVEDVTGRVPFKSADDLAGYAELDEARLVQLRRKYHFAYVVAERGAEPRLGLEPAFRGRHFVLYRLAPEP